MLHLCSPPEKLCTSVPGSLFGRPTSTERTVELHDGVVVQLQGLRLFQLGSEQGALGIQHFEVIHHATIVACPGQSRGIARGHCPSGLRIIFRTVGAHRHQGILHFAERLLQGALVGQNGLLRALSGGLGLSLELA